MQKRHKKLTELFVKTVNVPGKYGDGRGGTDLQIVIRKRTNGGVPKSWIQRLRLPGKQISLGLGSFPAVSLARARALALRNAQRVADGQDPR